MPTILLDVLLLVTCTSYIVAALLFGRYLFGHGKEVALPPQAPRWMLAGVLLHAIHIVSASMVWNVCPVEGIHFPLSVLSMMMGVVYLLARKRSKIAVAGAFIAPLALSSLLASRFVGGGWVEPSSRMKSAILPLHVLVNVVGLALFSFAFAAATLYLVQERLLKKKRVEGVFKKLPPLDSLDRAEHRFLLAGFPLLTLGVITGTVWARKIEMGGAEDLFRAALSYTMWLLIALILLLRAAAGWRGRRAAYGTIVGFGFAMAVLALYAVRSPEPPSSGRHADRGSQGPAPARTVEALSTWGRP